MEDLYYINPTGDRVGPIGLADIPSHPITAETMIWRAGMTRWKKAGDVKEVCSYLLPLDVYSSCSQTPLIPEYRDEEQYERPNNHMGLAIVAIVLSLFCSMLTLPIGIVALVYAFQVDSKWNESRFKEAFEYSDKAKTWGSIGVYLPLCFAALMLLVGIIVVALI